MREFKQIGSINREKVWVEDALKHVYKAGEEGLSVSHESVAGALYIDQDSTRKLISNMVVGGLLQVRNHAITLTEEGNQYALQVIRAHRLYETYLARETSYQDTAWHKEAEHAEHLLSHEELNLLADRMGNPRYDPHGDPIPTREGALEPVQGRPLSEWPIGETALIVHVEDEPPAIFHEISSAKITAGMHLKILSVDKEDIRILVDGNEVRLRMACADNVHVDYPSALDQVPEHVERLAALGKGESASIVGISPLCRGAERRRLLDLGIVPGSKIQLDYTSPFSSPMAYLVRGTLIALRREQSEQILVTRD